MHALAGIVGPGPLPFDVIAGISAGAINGVAVASGAEDFQRTADRLRASWSKLTPDRIYRTGALELASIGTRWIRDLSAGGLIGKSGINYLLDPAPLRKLLELQIPIGRMRRHLRGGRVRAVAVSATSYDTGAGVSFFEGDAGIDPWMRSMRFGIRARITLDHIMASAAIPLFFPPVPIDGTFYGDGGVRMSYPMSPAIHLGANRIVAIGVRNLRSPSETVVREGNVKLDRLPVSEIAGVLLNAVFLDSLDADLERLDRMNATLAFVPPERLGRNGLDVRPVQALVLRPSEDLGRLAADENARFPAMLRYLLKGIGATGRAGEDLLSYLAFEPVYLRRAIELGERDTMARRDEIEAFFFDEPRRAGVGR